MAMVNLKTVHRAIPTAFMLRIPRAAKVDLLPAWGKPVLVWFHAASVSAAGLSRSLARFASFTFAGFRTMKCDRR